MPFRDLTAPSVPISCLLKCVVSPLLATVLPLLQKLFPGDCVVVELVPKAQPLTAASLTLLIFAHHHLLPCAEAVPGRLCGGRTGAQGRAPRRAGHQVHHPASRLQVRVELIFQCSRTLVSYEVEIWFVVARVAFWQGTKFTILLHVFGCGQPHSSLAAATALRIAVRNRHMACTPLQTCARLAMLQPMPCTFAAHTSDDTSDACCLRCPCPSRCSPTVCLPQGPGLRDRRRESGPRGGTGSRSCEAGES